MIENLEDIVLRIFNIAIIGGVTLTIFMIVFQGINVLNSRGDPSAFSKAKEKIKNTLIGLGVLLLSYVLLTTINPGIFNLDLKVGEINITPPPIFTSSPAPVKELDVYTFEEIPIGTITEELLAGVSSVETPCYQYETIPNDASGNIIIGNVVDQNKDGKIDEKDILLNKDLFYCMKLLTDAYKAKVSVHLSSLVNDLNQLMSNCNCNRCYTGRYVGDEHPSNHGAYGSYTGTCTRCSCSENGSCSCSTSYPTCRNPYWWSYCPNCCGNAQGCPQAQPNSSGSITNPIEQTIGDFEQYKYDPCPNRLEIQCKSEEINWLITGEKPREICFTENFIEETAPELPILLTLDDAIERMKFFKDYYTNHRKDLIEARSKMKIPWGERITLAEFNKLQSESENYKVDKSPFYGNAGDSYNVSRYCRNFHLPGENINDDQVCKALDGQRAYYYDGDSATFYFNEMYYNKYRKSFLSEDIKNQKKCTVIEGNMDSGFYSGVIPIGETVDAAVEWGAEIIKRIDLVIGEAEQIRDQAILIPPLHESCSSNRCKSGNSWFGSCSSSCGCSSEDCETSSCFSCVPKTCSGVCPIEDLCDIVNKIYFWKDEQEDDEQEDDVDVEIKYCFEPTTDADEKEKRENNMTKMGYLQKFDGYSNILLELADMTINSPNYYIEDLSELINGICSPPCNDVGLESGDFNLCDPELSIKAEERFSILEKLSYSRKKLTGCVKGYSAGYKDNPTEVIEVISCMEGVSGPGVLILPDFPYPNKSKDNPPYNNCYPQNSDKLTKEEKLQCFYNPLREGTASNPGCLLITKEYMDNYYCCN
jgi:hypothetical protein